MRRALWQGLGWKTQTGAQPSLSGAPYSGQRRATSQWWPVIPVAESQPGGCRLKAGSKFLSGDNVRASGGQAACLILGTHRTLGFPAGLRSARVPPEDSGCLWQGLGPLPNMLTAKAAAQPSCVSHQAGHTRNACLPAVPAVCWLAFVHAASKKVHGMSLPDARPLFQPCHALHCGLHGLLPGNEGPDLLLYVYYPSAMPGRAPHLRAESQANNLLARTGWMGDPKGPYL